MSFSPATANLPFALEPDWRDYGKIRVERKPYRRGLSFLKTHAKPDSLVATGSLSNR